MDLATMILEKSHTMVREDQLSNMIQLKLKFDSPNDEYCIYIKQHPKLKNSHIVEYLSAKLNIKKNNVYSPAVRYIFYQIFRKHLLKHNKHYFDAGECLCIDIKYKNEEIISDMHTICDKIDFSELSISANAQEESDELDFMFKFVTNYFNFVESIDM